MDFFFTRNHTEGQIFSFLEFVWLQLYHHFALSRNCAEEDPTQKNLAVRASRFKLTRMAHGKLQDWCGFGGTQAGTLKCMISIWSSWDGVNFPHRASVLLLHIVLVSRKVSIAHQCSGYYWAVFTMHQGCLSNTPSSPVDWEQEIHK